MQAKTPIPSTLPIIFSKSANQLQDCGVIDPNSILGKAKFCGLTIGRDMAESATVSISRPSNCAQLPNEPIGGVIWDGVEYPDSCGDPLPNDADYSRILKQQVCLADFTNFQTIDVDCMQKKCPTGEGTSDVCLCIDGTCRASTSTGTIIQIACLGVGVDPRYNEYKDVCCQYYPHDYAYCGQPPKCKALDDGTFQYDNNPYKNHCDGNNYITYFCKNDDTLANQTTDCTAEISTGVTAKQLGMPEPYQSHIFYPEVCVEGKGCEANADSVKLCDADPNLPKCPVCKDYGIGSNVFDGGAPSFGEAHYIDQCTEVQGSKLLKFKCNKNNRIVSTLFDCSDYSCGGKPCKCIEFPGYCGTPK
jgi:hypothetical protein